ncbi:alpha/beta-hydrolase [Trichodelitschia bisporula]|uniref:Alpha/beta-hydrolase n=1 Tax=Trichodelitschia bisporula TaxID=703511 RepID=A0A6G1I944_9PEZI|nr:alpha/beta-hydrolase [Trichodelitschia bisporula]
MNLLRIRPAVSHCRPLNRSRRLFSAAAPLRQLDLAFDYYEPEKCKQDPAACNAPIIFLHGLFGSRKNNRSISKVLSRDLSRPVYCVDLRNHGDSPHDPVHDYDHLAKDVENFIDVHKLKDVTLIGHSMGAKTAMAVALRSPNKVANLIPVDNAPVDASLRSDFSTYVRGMRKVEEANVNKQSEADEILQPYVKELPVRQFLLTNLIRPKGSPHLAWRIPLKYLAPSLDLMGDFPFKDPDQVRYEKPTLMIRGMKSPYVADEMLPIVGRFFPRFELVDIDAGHWVISENPEAFRRAVVDFLQDKA